MSSSSSIAIKPKRQNPNPNPNPNPNTNSKSTLSSCCNHSPSATLDLIILILVLFSCTFLVFSSLSHLFLTLTLTLNLPSFHQFPFPYLISFLFFLLIVSLFLLKSSRICSRKCVNPKCKGLKKALEFDVQIQGEECLREKGKKWKEIADLPWKGGQQGRNPDYELLRAELRKMAPINGRAVLLFRMSCGCPIAKLEAWGPKKGRQRHKRKTFAMPYLEMRTAKCEDLLKVKIVKGSVVLARSARYSPSSHEAGPTCWEFARSSC